MDRRRLVVVCLLLVVSTISWRRGVYYAGGLDPVVAVKGLLSVCGALLALDAARHVHRVRPVGVRTVAIVGAYASVSVVGGLITAAPLPSVVLALRVVLLGLTVYALLRAWPPIEVARALFGVMGAVGVVVAATGLPTLATGRLRGGVIPVGPNEIAFLCGCAALLIVWEIIRAPRWWHAAAAPLLLGIVYATGSRTGLVMLVLGLLLLVAQAPRLSVPAFVSVIAAMPVVGFLVLGTTLPEQFLERGQGGQDISSLNSRTIAWSAALDLPESELQRWFGSGLATRQVPVPGQYWTAQVIDSSWVSALVQAGLIGLALLLLLVVGTALGALLSEPRIRALWLAALAFVVGNSLLASGLLDANPPFLVLMLIAVSTELPVRRASGVGDPHSPPTVSDSSVAAHSSSA